MNWKERVAEDPHGSLERSAARRGLSLEELQARRKEIANVLGGDGANEHLSLNELHLFRSDPEQLSQVLLDHIDSCEYCKVLDGALSPDAVRGRTASTADDAEEWESVGGVVNESSFGLTTRRLVPMGVAAAVPIAMFGLLFGTGTLRFSSDVDKLLESQVSMLISSVEVPEEIRSAASFSFYSGENLASTWQSASCVQSRMTVSSVGPSNVELSWEQVPSGDIPSHCMMDGNEFSLVAGQNITPKLSVGQQVMVMTPPTLESDL